MNTISGRVLIVDDEVNIRGGLRDVLIKDGHGVTDVGSGEEALVTLASATYDVALVDIRMPGISGIELLQTIRERRPHLAVIILTGHGGLESAMAAIKAGAHDYLLKPAQPKIIRQTVIEAIASSRRHREQAHLVESLRTSLTRFDDIVAEEPAHNSTSTPDMHSLGVGDLHIDLHTHEMRRNGNPVHLSPTEFKLLVALASHPNDVVDYVTLAQLSLGYEPSLWEAKELIKRHVSAVRHKIEPDPTAPRYLLNVRGVGYRLTAPH
ncbi:MAG: response regulator transcription factor [Chloroflexi bacterium]|nr:response regulator transcription factor [Chloroflexota bacterium]